MLELFEELATAGVKTTIWTGGEPITHPDFERLLEGAIRAGLRVGVLSNGVGVTESKAEAIIRYADWFRISLDDTPNADKHIRCVPADFGAGDITTEVETSLHNLRRARRKYPESQCKVGLAYTIQNRNVYLVPEMVKYVSTSSIFRNSASQ